MYIEKVENKCHIEQINDNSINYQYDAAVLEILSKTCTQLSQELDIETFIREQVKLFCTAYTDALDEHEIDQEDMEELITKQAKAALAQTDINPKKVIAAFFTCLSLSVQMAEAYTQDKDKDVIRDGTLALKIAERYEGRASFDEMVSNIHEWLCQSYFKMGQYQESAAHLLKIPSEEGHTLYAGLAALTIGHASAYSKLRQEEMDDRLAGLLMRTLDSPCMFAMESIEYASQAQLNFRQRDYVAAIHQDEPLYKAVSLAMLNQFDAAIEEYTRFLEEHPDADVYMERGLVYLLKKDVDHALADFKKAESLQLPYFLQRNDVMFLPTSSFLIDWVNRGSAHQ